MTDVYAGVDQITLRDEFPASAVCDLLEVSRSGFYAWRAVRTTRREARDRELMPWIRRAFFRHRRRYGARRITMELTRQGIACGVARVARLMKNQGLRAIQPPSFRPRTTESRHGLGYNANLLARRPAPTTVNEVWVSDITYIPLGTRQRDARFGYLALVMDLCSRRIVGWEFGLSMEETLTLGALRRAIQERQPASGLIHHSDRGGQYAGGRYRATLRRAGALQSMSAAGNCYDNAFMESCFGTVKTELELVEYADASEAARELTSYIRYYNLDRLHSSLGYETPAGFEKQLSITK